MPKFRDKTFVIAPIISKKKLRITHREHSRSQEILNNLPRKSIIKTEEYKTILIANPAYVKFVNFECNKLYKKIIKVKNVSAYPAKFRIEARPTCSRFTVMIKSTLGETNSIPAGMELKLTVCFRCDILDEPEELLVINVQYGKPVFIKLHGYRDSPILKVIKTSLQHTKLQSYIFGESITSIESWYSRKNNTNILEQSSSSEISDSINSKEFPICDSTSKTIFDCGKCFVGEQIDVTIIFKNIGGPGRCFVMSEIDWCSMHVKDITTINMLVLPSFAIWPVYFSLKPQKEIFLRTYFFPDSYGIHVERLYMVCDNCSTIATEMIGDGVMYEPTFFKCNELRKLDNDFNNLTTYFLDLGMCISSQTTQNIISIINTSEIGMHFRWDKKILNKNVKASNCKDFPLECVNVSPQNGFFSPLSKVQFTVIVETPDLFPKQYTIILQFYAEDIPVAAISKKLDLHIEDCSTKQRTCLKSVNVLVAEIEVSLKYESSNLNLDSLDIYPSEAKRCAGEIVELTAENFYESLH